MSETAAGRVAIAKESEIGEGEGRRFEAGKGLSRVDGFVVRFEGKLYAYVNRCKHMPLPLDLVKNHFFTANKRSLRCQSHGAAYEPATGKCFAGPCRGKSLDPLPVSVEEGIVYYVGDGRTPSAPRA